jgi:hypothetical protein
MAFQRGALDVSFETRTTHQEIDPQSSAAKVLAS